MTSKQEETVVYGDNAQRGAAKREDADIKNSSGKRIRYKLNRRPSQIKKGSNRCKPAWGAENTKNHQYKPKSNTFLE